MHEDDVPLTPLSHQVIFTQVACTANGEHAHVEGEGVANGDAAHINDEHT